MEYSMLGIEINTEYFVLVVFTIIMYYLIAYSLCRVVCKIMTTAKAKAPLKNFQSRFNLTKKKFS